MRDLMPKEAHPHASLVLLFHRLRRYAGHLAILLVLVGCEAPPVSALDAGSSLKTVPAALSVPVTAALAKHEDVPVKLEGLGTVQALNTVTIKPRVSGQIIDLPFAEGQEMQAGAIVAHIDPRPYAAALHQAVAAKAKDEAQLANARLQLIRFSSLAEKSFTPAQNVDNQRAQVATLEAAVDADDAAIESAQTQLDYATISSPIAGVAGIRMVDAGNVVSPSDPGIVVITQLQPITIIFTLPGDAVRYLPVGQPHASLPVATLARDHSTKLAEGTLTLVDNRIDPATGMVKLKATFENKDRALKPGQFVVASLHIETLLNVITLPSNAVQQDPNGSFVYIIQPDWSTEKRRVDVARTDGTLAIIADGIRAGEQVVLDGQYGLRPGAKVVVQPSDGNAATQMATTLLGLP